MSQSSGYISIISGERRGLGAALARGGLHSLSWAYGRLVGLRNAYYDTWAMPKWLEVPVISVGNLTVGGTGKTPMALWLCERLLERGLKPAVLSRGYKASEEGLADELLMLSRRCPRAVAIAHPDRLRSGQLAIEQYRAQAVILDDGFQHRRLGRDLDVLLMDTTRPFGYGYILPRGLLRESGTSVHRADVVVLTRYDQCEPGAPAAIEAEVRRFNPRVPIVYAVHRPAGFVDLIGNKMPPPAGPRIGCLAGIAHPEALLRTLADLGPAPVDTYWFPDHHAYTAGDVEAAISWARGAHLDAVVTTEKDAVKLMRLPADWPVPVATLRVRIEMLADGDKILGELIDQMLRDHAEEFKDYGEGQAHAQANPSDQAG